MTLVFILTQSGVLGKLSNVNLFGDEMWLDSGECSADFASSRGKKSSGRVFTCVSATGTQMNMLELSTAVLKKERKCN